MRPCEILLSVANLLTFFLLVVRLWSQADIDEHQNTMRAVFESLPGDGYFVRVPGMFHNDFSDFPLFSPLTSWVDLTANLDLSTGHP